MGEYARIFATLSDEQKKYRIPDEVFEAIYTFSLEYEAILEKGALDSCKALPLFSGDLIIHQGLLENIAYIREELNLIDNFHLGCPGSEYCFFTRATMLRVTGVLLPHIDILLLPAPESEEGDYQTPIAPPIQGYSVEEDGRLVKWGEEGDLDDPLSAEVNFYKGLTTGSNEQKEYFSDLLFKLEYGYDKSVFDMLGDDLDFPFFSAPPKEWNDTENHEALRAAPAHKKSKGRPRGSSADRELVKMITTAKCLYFSNIESFQALPSLNGAVTSTLDHYGVAEHNKGSKNKRLTRALKLKLAARGFGQKISSI